MSDPTKQNRDINSLQSVAQKACSLFLDECSKRGIKIFVTEYHRSQERQNWLYEQGRTRPGKVITWTRNSNHSTGYAWDIAVSPPHDLYDGKIIAYAGEVAKKLGIEWGGSWKEQDTPHFQVSTNWKAPTIQDEDYQKAVQKLVMANIIGSPAAWQKVNLKNVPALLNKLGGVQKLYEKKIISSKELWESGEYNENHVIALIKKVAAIL